jgi:hypothetical protein
VQRQFVLHHHAGKRQAGLFTVVQHLLSGFERIRHVHIASGIFAEMLFINDKSAADGVIGFAVDHFIAAEGVDLHAVFVQGEVVAAKTHAVILREVNFVLTVCQQQAAAGFYVADKRLLQRGACRGLFAIQVAADLLIGIFPEFTRHVHL